MICLWTGPLVASTNLRDPSTKISKKKRKRPIIYTFFHLKLKRDMKEDIDKTHKRMLDAWKEAWSSRGWDPIILDLDDARKHPDFDKYNDQFKDLTPNDAFIFGGSYNHMCLMRWLAVAAQKEDGWMSDYDTFPMNIRIEDGLDLPNSGTFTSFEKHVPSLMSGSASEWERVSKEILDRVLRAFDEKGAKVKYSDMLAMMDIYRESGYTAYVSVRKVAGYPYIEMGKMNCKLTKNVLAVHLSHAYTDRAIEDGIIPELGNHEQRYVYSNLVLSDWREQCSPDIETD